jgi:hypothetical protein
MSTTNDNDSTRNHCTTCDDLGEVRSQRMTPEADCDLEACPDCPGGDGARATPRGDGYLAAPALELVATACCLCGRALLDAASVERGVGPTCAKRAGVGDAAHPAEWERVRALLGALGLSPRGYDDARAEANRITHRIGAAPSAPEVPQLLEVIEALGYHRLAAAIAEHVVPVTITVANDNDTLVVTTSRLDDTLFEQYVLALRAVPGRHWDTERKANIVPVRSKRALWEALKKCLPKGAVVVGARV